MLQNPECSDLRKKRGWGSIQVAVARGGRLERQASLWWTVLEADVIKLGRGLPSKSGSLLSSWGYGAQASLGVIKEEAEGEWSVVGTQRGSRAWGKSESG